MTPLKFLFFPKNSTIFCGEGDQKKKLGKEFTTGKNIFLQSRSNLEAHGIHWLTQRAHDRKLMKSHVFLSYLCHSYVL